MRKEGDSAKSINEMLLSRLSRYRASPSATLAALTGSTISNTLKEDQAGKGQLVPRSLFFLAFVAFLPKGGSWAFGLKGARSSLCSSEVALEGLPPGCGPSSYAPALDHVLHLVGQNDLPVLLTTSPPFSSAANTSCGLPLKMLRKTPIYTCGTYLVMLVPPPGGSGSSATRSLFGGSGGLSSLKSKFPSLSALGEEGSLERLCGLPH